jgi:hypothetical protein
MRPPGGQFGGGDAIDVAGHHSASPTLLLPVGTAFPISSRSFSFIRIGDGTAARTPACLTASLSIAASAQAAPTDRPRARAFDSGACGIVFLKFIGYLMSAAGLQRLIVFAPL